jgi:hypothetical protein
VADAIRTYAVELDAVVLQPVAEITDAGRLGTNVHDQIDVIRCAGRIYAVLGCEKPHHLPTD